MTDDQDQRDEAPPDDADDSSSGLGEARPERSAGEPAGDAPPDGPDLSPEELAVVPEDTPLRHLLEDRRVRLALIVGLPLFVAVLIGVAILAQSIGIARSVVIDGPTRLAPASRTAVRVSYDEMDDYGLPHELPVQSLRFELCVPGGTPLRPAATPTPTALRHDAAGRSCVELGRLAVPNRGHDLEVPLVMPEVPDGRYPVRIELQAGEERVTYEFPASVTSVPQEPLSRDNGRAALRPLGHSGVAVDLVPLGGGLQRGRTSSLVLRALGPDGFPYVGTLWLLGIGELGQAGVPETVTTDAAGLAPLQFRPEVFEYRLAVSTVPYPAMDPLEAAVGLLPENVLDRAALIEIGFQPILGRLVTGETPDAEGGNPFLRAGEPLALSFADGAGPRAPLQVELWREGRLEDLTSWPAEAPAVREVAQVRSGLSFVQVHRPAGPEDGVVGRHVWGGTGGGPTADELRALLAALAWPADDQAWVSGVRRRLDELDATARLRLGRYVLGRRDAIWYPVGVLFDSRPIDRERATAVREGIKTAMAWAIGGVALVLVAGATVLGVAGARYRRRQRGLGVIVPSTAQQAGEAPVSMYDRAPWWVQHAVVLRVAAVLLILALALAALAVLMWGMKQTYW